MSEAIDLSRKNVVGCHLEACGNAVLEFPRRMTVLDHMKFRKWLVWVAATEGLVELIDKRGHSVVDDRVGNHVP